MSIKDLMCDLFKLDYPEGDRMCNAYKALKYTNWYTQMINDSRHKNTPFGRKMKTIIYACAKIIQDRRLLSRFERNREAGVYYGSVLMTEQDIMEVIELVEELINSY